MLIRNMFADDIDRKINGVVKVFDSDDQAIEQEVREYVITSELKKHFMTFFSEYGDAFDEPTADVGVWISGFFGSGKSHFLKMLSYILDDREIGGVRTQSSAALPTTPAPSCSSTAPPAPGTETILFNIDVESSINKDKTAVLRVFAKVFYDHLGFYGDNLKVAMLEKYIDQQGKTAAFCAAFEQRSGKRWQEARKAFAFNGKHIIPALVETLDMREDDARAWFADKSPVEFSIARLVEDIREYVDGKGDDFRLLFMADEVGQYVGTDTDMLLNLQSLTGKAGQRMPWQSVDRLHRAGGHRRDHPRARRRIFPHTGALQDTPQPHLLLGGRGHPKAHTAQDARGGTDAFLGLRRQRFRAAQPLYLYRLHPRHQGFFRAAGICRGLSLCALPVHHHAKGVCADPQARQLRQTPLRRRALHALRLSGGGRRRCRKGTNTPSCPSSAFYDTVHSFLDSSIRRVIERCQRAAEAGDGLKARDVDVLKLLYLLRYIDDIKSCLDNLVILMAEDIRVDKIALRAEIAASLGSPAQPELHRPRRRRLQLPHRRGNRTYSARYAKRTWTPAAIVERIGHMIFEDIYPARKYRYGKYDFAFDRMVDA